MVIEYVKSEVAVLVAEAIRNVISNVGFVESTTGTAMHGLYLLQRRLEEMACLTLPANRIVYARGEFIILDSLRTPRNCFDVIRLVDGSQPVLMNKGLKFMTLDAAHRFLKEQTS